MLLSVDGKYLKIRHGAQKLSEAVFCRPLNPQPFRVAMQKNAALNFCAPELSIY
ncbi:hypothetical protein QUF90_26170 [Desulfococcaceae bacterium HSG9]|nr:hypothetical protein [Desulfococcaceae bacterium HSG9]